MGLSFQGKITSVMELFTSRRIALMIFFGFYSGLPLPLTGGTLQAWMTVEGVDLKTIGIFALAGLPYTLKFLWSPLMDRFVPPWLGRRRGWILASQVSVMAGIAAMAHISPRDAPLLMGAFALFIAFSSASQDIVIDAYRTDLLHAAERGFGAAVFVTGYRVAMLVSGALALILSDYLGWQTTYLIMAALMIPGMVITFFSPDPEKAARPPATIGEAVLGPLRDFFSRKEALQILLLIVLYKLGDAYAGTLTTAFLIRGLEFSASDVGFVNKGLGLAAVIIGAFFGGTLMVRFGLFRSLLFFGILQAVSNLSFMVLAWAGKSYPLMVAAVAFENVAGGMGTTAYVSLLMGLCNQKYSATQFALLSSLAAIGRTFVAPSSGFVVEAVGWADFFFITFITALPGLWMVWKLRTKIPVLEKEPA